MLGLYIPVIDKWLELDLKEPRKQRHTAKRIYVRLQQEYGFDGSYETVKDYVRAERKKLGTNKTQGYLPLSQPKTHAQIDFGQFKYYDSLGGEHTDHALTLAFPYSNAAFTQVFPSENQEYLLEGLKCIFNYIGGVLATADGTFLFRCQSLRGLIPSTSNCSKNVWWICRVPTINMAV